MVSALQAAPPDLLDRADAACARLARDHYENFPVASMLVPKRMRRAVAAVYAFARHADDVADEPGRADAERLRLLDDWEDRARRAATRPVADAGSAALTTEDLIFVAVADAMRRHDLPLPLFTDLLSAFRQDVTVKRYDTWTEVLDYCRRSANPVGRLVLRIGGYGSRLDESSDALCTALQLTNFWQDFARDWANGRLYVPLSDCDAFGAREVELARVQAASAGAAGGAAMPPAWKAVLREMVRRTRLLFDQGRPVCDGVHGRLRYELRLTWLGGRRILERLEHADFETFGHRPTLGARDVAPLVWRTASWTRA